MRKPGLIISGIVVVLMLASPFAIGVLTERNVRSQLETYYSDALLAVRVASYDTGWFKSHARLEIGLGSSYLSQIETAAPDPAIAQMLQSFSIPIVLELTHGPLLLGEVSGTGLVGVTAMLDPESELNRLAQAFLGVPYVFELRGKSGFGSGFEFSGDIPPIEGAAMDVSYAFSGLNVSGTARRGHVVYGAVIDSASLQSPFMSGLVQSLAMHSDMHMRSGEISVGTSEITLGRVTASNPLLGATPMFAAEDLSLATTVSETDNGSHLNLAVVYGLGRIAIADAFALSDAALGIRLAHLDRQAVNEIIEAMSSVDITGDPSALAAMMLPLADRILAGGPELTLDPLQFSMAEGAFNGRVHLSLDSSALPTGRIDDLMSPEIVRRAVSAEADLTAAKPLVQMLTRLAMAQGADSVPGPNGDVLLPPEQVAAMLDSQVQETLAMLTGFGIVAESGNNYSCSIRLANGTVTANGQPLPLPF